MSTYTYFKLGVCVVLLSILQSACGGKPTPPIVGNLQGVPTTVAPGVEIPIYIDVVQADESLSINWSFQPPKGEIVFGQGTSAIQYRAPTISGIYVVKVEVTADNYHKEMSAPVTVITPTPYQTLTLTSTLTLTQTSIITETSIIPPKPTTPPNGPGPWCTPLSARLDPYTQCPYPVEGASGNVQYCPQAGKFVARVELHGLEPKRSYRFSLQAAEIDKDKTTDSLLFESCDERTESGDAYCDATLELTDEQGTLQDVFSIGLKPGHYDLKFLLKDAQDENFCVAMKNDDPQSIDVMSSQFQMGMSFVTWQSGSFNTEAADKALEELAATGTEWIALVVTGYQDDISATTIQFDPQKTPTDDDLIHVINKAREFQLRVMLKPHVDMLKDPDHWRGQIGTNFEEAEWQAWFASYRDFINHYATLAAQNQDVVKVLCVGTELVTTSSRDMDWRQVLQEVRTSFIGELVYASNWDEPAQEWWADLDYIGVDAYFPLYTASDTPSVENLIAAWQPHVLTLENLHNKYERPVIITELGYRSVRGTHAAPAEYKQNDQVDLTEQENLYRAAMETLCGKDWLTGIYWWNWLTDPNQGGPNDTDYTLHGKPAETVLIEYYRDGKCTPPPGTPFVLIPYPGFPIDDSRGEGTYATSSGNFQASIKLTGLKPNHSYIFTINCKKRSATCDVLAKVPGCQVRNKEGYCDFGIGATDAAGMLESNIQKTLPSGEYNVKFFVKDPLDNYCITLFNDNIGLFTVP